MKKSMTSRAVASSGLSCLIKFPEQNSTFLRQEVMHLYFSQENIKQNRQQACKQGDIMKILQTVSVACAGIAAVLPASTRTSDIDKENE
jgi:hypothetical protein